ncbi:DNA-processing protein DprA [Aliivibrio kagoshimensis]|uniref:DNA-processing protein DprA n=1 Tax=Aliivibrio kagoshimensis TaxID=2910230 RepID=UPI003D12C618
MDEKTLIPWLTLGFTPGLGGQKLSRLLSIDSPENLLSYSSQQLVACGLSASQVLYLHAPLNRDIERALQWQSQPSCHILHLHSPYYPSLLKEIASPPPILFVQGRVNALSAPQIAVVGSRNATVDGLESAHQFSYELAKQGYVITSGLALGVDGYAHQGALKAEGETIAVLGSGLSEIYPARHRTLAQKIIEQGALVSEFRPDAKPRPQHFPRRNRMISGLSTGVLVIEAAEKSGSLITARYANEQGREVFALPGSIHNPTSRGCNALIKGGAYLVDNINEIINEVGVLTECAMTNQMTLFEVQSQVGELPFPEVLANVGSKVTPVDFIAQACNQPVHEIMMQLLELELQGFIIAVPGGYIRKRRG